MANPPPHPLKPDDHIFWFDLETDGSDTDRTHILEFGAALVRRTDLSVVSTFTGLLAPPVYVWNIDPAVLHMHTTNHLWNDIGLALESNSHYETVEELEADILFWLNYYIPSKKHISVAGSGILHFDMPILKRLMPRLKKRLKYYANPDVGIIRRALVDWGWESLLPGSDHLTHRALQDVMDQIDEYRKYRDFFRAPPKETSRAKP